MENTSVEAPAHTSSEGNFLSPDVAMMLLTWLTFFILLAILKKFAFKPILEALQKREEFIRKSLDDADKAKVQLAQIDMEKAQILSAAKAQASLIIDEARKTATTVAHETENKARGTAQDMLKNAQTQIEGERQKVRQALKVESVNVAIVLAGKILKENTDTDKNRRLVEEAVKEL